MTAKKIWGIINNSLKKNLLLGSNYYIFIDPLKPICVMDKTLYIESPNKFTLSVIKKRYMDIICEDLKLVDPSLNIEIITSVEREIMDIEYEPSSNLNSIEEEESESYNSAKRASNLIPGYTFDNFIIGDSNKMAHATAWAVATNPGQTYNPFFIYGKSGIGKTHLMHAIAHKLAEDKPNLNVMYVPSEQFTNELIESIRMGKNAKFRKKYRSLDVLMIDDVQFLDKKPATQEEFFHTFNALTSNNSQIIMSSDRFPKEIKSLEDRLVNRFESGIVSDIGTPELETRIAILQQKSQLEKYNAPPEIIYRIAEAVDSNIRELIGVLIRAHAFVNIGDYTYEEAIPIILKEMFYSRTKKIEPETIIDYVAKEFNLEASDIIGKDKTKEVSYVRHIAMYITRELTDLSYPDIAACFGDRHHSTIISAWKKIKELTYENAELKRQTAKLIKDIKNL